MRRSTPKTSSLKLVMHLDRRNRTCCVCSHNLDVEDASQEVTELRRDGLAAFTVASVVSERSTARRTRFMGTSRLDSLCRQMQMNQRDRSDRRLDLYVNFAVGGVSLTYV